MLYLLSSLFIAASLAEVEYGPSMNAQGQFSKTFKAKGIYRGEAFCDNRGNMITVGGTLLIPGLKANVFAMGGGGNHQAEAEMGASFEIFMEDDLVLPKGQNHPFLTGVGGNPRIGVRPSSSDCGEGMIASQSSQCKAIVELGRCKQLGTGKSFPDMELFFDLAIDGLLECDNSGSHITFGGKPFKGNMDVDIIFNAQSPDLDDSRDQAFTSAATMKMNSLEGFEGLPKSPAKGGVGGNPYLFFQVELKEPNGMAKGFESKNSEMEFFGRCVTSSNNKNTAAKAEAMLDQARKG